jgi:hypothetical protein
LPKLHLKEQAFMSRSVLMRFADEDMAGITAAYFETRWTEVTATESEPSSNKRFRESMSAIEWPPDAIRTVIVGSHNQDRRSMLLDGEAMVCISGEGSVGGILDMIILTASVDWIGDPDAIDQEFPEAGGLIRALVQLIRDWI